MKANTIVSKAAFVGTATGATIVKSTTRCAVVTASIAAPTILGTSVYTKLTHGKWNVKKNAVGFLKGAAVASAVCVSANATRALVCSTVAAITTKEPTAEDFEAEMDDFDRYVAD